MYCYNKGMLGSRFSACSNTYVSSVLGSQVPLPLDFAVTPPSDSPSNWCGFKDDMVYCDDGSSYSTADQSQTFYNMPSGVAAGALYDFSQYHLINKNGDVYLYNVRTHETSYVDQLYCN